MESESSKSRDLSRAHQRQILSALLDGEGQAAELDRVCLGWVADREDRIDWHAYALIGDVLRADDLAVSPQRDEEFLQALRGQLAAEPVPLAPRPLVEPVAPPLAESLQVIRPVAPSALSGHRRWGTAGLMAGTAVAVVGLMLSLRPWPGAGDALPTLAQGAVAPGAAVPVSLNGETGFAQATGQAMGPGTVQMVRNPELDRYLAAHRQYAQGPALAAPGGLRQVAVMPDGE